MVYFLLRALILFLILYFVLFSFSKLIKIFFFIKRSLFENHRKDKEESNVVDLCPKCGELLTNLHICK